MSVTYDKDITALLVIDPYNDFISEGGKLWDRLKAVAEANDCVPHMLLVLNAAWTAGLRIFYALHHRYRPGDYETWKYIAPVQKAAWSHKTFEYGTWGGEASGKGKNPESLRNLRRGIHPSEREAAGEQPEPSEDVGPDSAAAEFERDLADVRWVARHRGTKTNNPARKALRPHAPPS
jgi:hypothetical protein